jgi:hypothetical protein
LIPKRTKNTDITGEIADGHQFKKRLLKLADEVADRFINGERLSDAIADVAKREKFTQIQVQRLVEEGNTVAYNKKYATMKKDKDRRVSYEIASLEDVLASMGSDAPPKVDNPNFVTGQTGEGEIKKEASARSVHNPYANLDAGRQRMMEKRAHQVKVANEKEQRKIVTSIKSDIFKFANCLVRTEQLNKNANTIYNTILSDVSLDSGIKELIEKKSHDISTQLAETGRARNGFVVSLKEDYMQKIASNVLGEQSLLNTKSNKKEAPKVAPTGGISDYEQLVSLAKRIQQQQEHSMSLNG